MLYYFFAHAFVFVGSLIFIYFFWCRKRILSVLPRCTLPPPSHAPSSPEKKQQRHKYLHPSPPTPREQKIKVTEALTQQL